MAYLSRGWAPVPVVVTKDAASGKKKVVFPVSWQQFQTKVPSRDTIAAWWGHDPSYGVAIITGKVSGIVVLDQDGDCPFLKGKDIPPTPTVRTAKGFHRYFRWPGFDVRNQAPMKDKDGRDIRGLDVRGDGGVVIAPPTRHPLGDGYDWVIFPDEADPAPLPDWAMELLAHPTKPPKVVAVGKTIPEGKRNSELASVAGAMRRKGATAEEIRAALTEMNKRAVPPLPDDEVARIANSIARYPSADERPIPTTITAKELSTMKLPDPRWVIPDLIAEGLTLLAGRPKIGKSWLCLGLAMAVSGGGEALGAKRVEPGDVLYLGLEDIPRRLQSRINLIGEPTDRLHLANRWARADQGGIEDLDRWAADHPDARLIVVDTLARFRAPHKANSDLYAGDYAAMAMLKEVADAHGLGIVACHHTRKMMAEDPLDSISGTTGLSGGCDTAAVLARGRGDADAILSIAGRDVPEQELALRFENGVWELLGDARDVTMSNTRRTILDLIAKSRAPVTPREVAEALGRNRSTIRNIMATMAIEGTLVARGGGYTLP
ncbi:MAG: AAA family ATPase [Candidatus Bipolaricaulis anaerobius]|jgi:hypothetical protein